MAAELGLELGSYHHFAASLHLYAKHRRLAERIIAVKYRTDFAMPELREPKLIPSFLNVERAIRKGEESPLGRIDRYWDELVEVLRLFRDAGACGWELAMERFPRENIYQRVMKPLGGSSLKAAGSSFR
jgi:hypothetical protein